MEGWQSEGPQRSLMTLWSRVQVIIWQMKNTIFLDQRHPWLPKLNIIDKITLPVDQMHTLGHMAYKKRYISIFTRLVAKKYNSMEAYDKKQQTKMSHTFSIMWSREITGQRKKSFFYFHENFEKELPPTMVTWHNSFMTNKRPYISIS